MDNEAYDVIRGNVVKRLESLKYEVDNEKDDFLINYIMKMVDPRKNVLMRALGANTTVEMDIFEVEMDVDVIFLCSDGLTNMLTDEQIEATVTSIKEGDTQVSFDKDSAPQAVFDVLVSRLINYGNDDFAKYRRFLW